MKFANNSLQPNKLKFGILLRIIVEPLPEIRGHSVDRFNKSESFSCTEIEKKRSLHKLVIVLKPRVNVQLYLPHQKEESGHCREVKITMCSYIYIYFFLNFTKRPGSLIEQVPLWGPYIHMIVTVVIVI